MAIFNAMPFTLTNGQTADATQVMANFNQIVNNGNANAAHSGANSDLTSISGLTTALSGAQGGTLVFMGGTTAGAASAQTLASTTPNSFTLTANNRVTFTAGFTNTGAVQLNVNSTGLTNVFRRTSGGLTALVGGEIISGQRYSVDFDGTQYELMEWSGSQPINANTTSGYTYVGADSGKLVTRTNAANMADTLPQAGSTSAAMPTGWWTEVEVLGGSVGALTITPTISTIDGNASLTLQPGQSVKIVSDGTNFKVPRGQGLMLQTVFTETGAATTGTNTYPNPMTDVPLTATGGDQYMSITVTPTTSLSVFRVEAVAFLSATSPQTGIQYGLFQDSTNNALAGGSMATIIAASPQPAILTHSFTPGTTSATVLKFRAGQLAGSGQTLTFNGVAGSRVLGGTFASTMRVIEFLP